MSERDMPMLVPQYVRTFRCIGTACEDTCCHGWQVPIDEETYKKYQACPDEGLLVQMSLNVKQNRTNPTPEHDATIELNLDSNCPFLDTERLCSIQKRLGEEYLSLVCMSYPRVSHVVNGVLEQAMTMSCPEAARLALLDPAVMEFDALDQSPSRNSVSYSVDMTSLPTDNAGHYFWELRIFVIQLLQNRDYALEERLLLLGMFCRAVEGLIEQGRVTETRQLIASYMANIERGAYRAHLDGLPTRNQVQTLLLTQIVDPSLLTTFISARYQECLAEFSSGIGNVDGALTEDVTRRYSEACEKYYEPFMREHGYILENLLVNLVFRNLFPFTRDGGVFANYVKVAMHFALIRTFLIGMSGFHKEGFNSGHVIKLIQSFSKTIEHNDTYLKQLHAFLVASDGASLAHMALMINSGSSGRRATEG